MALTSATCYYFFASKLNGGILSMKANQVWTKLGRAAVTLVMIGGLLMTSAVSAFADNGGNGEGTLAIFTSTTPSQGTSTSNLNSGGTYYIELLNPGGSTRLTQLKNVPTTLTFNFFTPAVNFQGNPGKYAKDTPAGTVQGTEVGTESPYIYKITVPANLAKAYYTIETGAPMSHGGNGEDEFYFSTDPSVNGNQGVQILNPAGQLPEMPYPVVIPALFLVGAVAVFSLRRKAVAKH